MSGRAIARRYGRVERFHVLGRTGFVSDDTEQTALVAQCLARHPHDVGAFTRAFRRALLGWFLRLPFGIGWATLRACLRIAFGFRRSGVWSAGNGAAMRAAIVGVGCPDEAQRLPFGRALAEVTHRDPRAVEGALFVAELAHRCSTSTSPRSAMVERARTVVEEPSLRVAIAAAVALASDRATPEDAATRLGSTGFVVHTVGLATFVLLRYGDDPREALVQAVAAGGDTDSIAAIVGAWVGALHGASGLPHEWIERLQQGPFGRKHLDALARALMGSAEVPRLQWGVAMGRNLLLGPVLLLHAIGVAIRG
jgi:ADP-ribosylglycohydrolase